MRHPQPLEHTVVLEKGTETRGRSGNGELPLHPCFLGVIGTLLNFKLKTAALFR